MPKSQKKRQIRRSPSVNYKAIIKACNSAMLDACTELKSTGIPAFQSNVLSDVLSLSDAADITVKHRIISKFGKPAKSSLRDVAFNSYKLFEQHLGSIPQIDNLWQEGREFFFLRKAKTNLGKWLKTFKLDYNSIAVEFTPGESYTSATGQVSVFAKLSSLAHWTCTADVVDDVCHLVYHNRGLKAAARKHIGLMVPIEGESGFDTFSRHLMGVITIVPGARGTSVPKNQETDRFINVEPTFNMILQRWVAGEINRCLTLAGNRLGASRDINRRVIYHDAQELHKEMIRDLSYATIDFSNASDSVLLWVVQLLFPKHVSYVLTQYRSSTVQLGSDVIEPNKLSSMGNGFTFEVMTILLLSIGRIFDPTCRVYGDDVIIKASVANDFINTVSFIAFATNEKKTFLNGLFRESCGAFQFDTSDIQSFEFKWADNFADVIAICNKLKLIIDAAQCSEAVIKILRNVHTVICECVPVLSKGPQPPNFNLFLSQFVYDDNWKKKQMKSDLAITKLNRLVDRQWGFFSATHHHPEELCYVNIPVYVPRRDSVSAGQELFVDLSNLYALRFTKTTVRGKGKWVNVPHWVTPVGSIYRASRIRRQYPNIGELPTCYWSSHQLDLITS